MRKILNETCYRLNLAEAWDNLSYLLNPCALARDVADEWFHILDEMERRWQ
jgi:hypothetical protein